MSWEIVRHPQARHDLLEQYVYIGEDSPDAAERFLDCAEATFEQIATVPGMGSPYRVANPRLQGLRMWPVRHFEKHLVFYLIRPNAVEVIRVIHAARDPKRVLEREV